MSERVFVGGLAPSVTQQDVMDKFGAFGAIHSVEMKRKPTAGGTTTNTFCYITMHAATGKVHECKWS